MIGVQLPPIRPDATADYSEAMEAFMLCLLASYGPVAPESRTMTSFKRALGYDSITFFDRVPGVSPPYLIATWTNFPNIRAVVAIAGVTQLRDYFTLTWHSSARTVTGSSGKVFGAWGIAAEAINTALASQYPFSNQVAMPVFQISFAGFSMGAAIAEVLANMYANTRAGRLWKTFGFAKPRVGNYRWLYYRNPNLRINNYILDRDPISTLPDGGPTHTSAVLTTVPTFWTSFVRDHLALRLAHNGDQLPAYGVEQERANMVQAAKAFQTIDQDNPWFDHRMVSYRLALQNLIHRTNAQSDYRFRYLELPDNNAFGVQFNGQEFWTDVLDGLYDPGPDDVAPPREWIQGGDQLVQPPAQWVLDQGDAPDVIPDAPSRRPLFNVETNTITRLRRRVGR